jgi:hypothetical protein
MGQTGLLQTTMSELYSVIFRGNILPGQQLPEVKARLAQLLKLDELKLASVFSGKPVLVRKDCDLATAEKVKAALAKAGADAEIRPNVALAPVSQAVPAPAPASAAPVEVAAGILKVAPVGSMMSEAERAALRKPPVQVKVDHIALEKRASSFLVADDKPVKARPAKIQAPDFGVAPTGADLLKPDEKRVFEELELDLSSLSLAKIGADILPEDQKQPPLMLVIEEMDVDLAPAGSDLGQIKKAPPPPPPKTDHLKLV